MRSARLLAVLVLLAATLAGSVAQAAPPDDNAKHAREAFNDGTTFFNLGQWDKAIDAWQAGYKLKPDPIFLYNIAQAYRLADNFDKALFFYRSYLRNLAKPPNKAEVDDRIAQIEHALEERKRAREMPPEVPLAAKSDPVKTETARTNPVAEEHSQAGGETTVVSGAPPRPHERRADLSVSGGIDIFAVGAGSLTLSGGFALSGGYDVLTRDRVAVRIGAKLGYSFLGDTNSTVSFISALVDPMQRFRLWKERLYAYVEVGVGALIISGLDNGSKLLVARALPTGAFAAFELRPAVGLEFRILPSFALFLTPTLMYSPSPHQYFADSTLLRFDVQLGGEVRF
jgi:tetratricopeptide (TPR) repeat protein